MVNLIVKVKESEIIQIVDVTPNSLFDKFEKAVNEFIPVHKDGDTIICFVKVITTIKSP